MTSVKWSDLKEDAHASVQGLQVAIGKHRCHGVRLHTLLHCSAKADGTIVEVEQGLQGAGTNHAALVNGGQDGDFIVTGSPKTAAVVKVNGVCVIAEQL